MDPAVSDRSAGRISNGGLYTDGDDRKQEETEKEGRGKAISLWASLGQPSLPGTVVGEPSGFTPQN